MAVIPSEPQQWASQAALNALLRYKPQKEGLAELRKAAEDRFRESVAAGQSEGIMGQQAARQAIPATQQIFKTARTSGERGRDLVAPILAALSADSPFKAAAANEQAAGTERLGQSEAHALSDLQQRSTAAAELPAFERQAAMATLVKELQKLTAKDSLLRGSEGADVQGEIGKQRQEANRLAQSERASERSAATSRANSERSTSTSRENSRETNATRRQTAAAKGSKPLSLKEQDAAVGIYATIHEEAKALKAQGFSRAAIVHALSSPVPSVSKEEADGSKVATKGHAGYSPNGVMAAAVDTAEVGGLTKDTERRLRSEGYDPRRFGKPAPPPPKPISPGPHRRPA